MANMTSFARSKLHEMAAIGRFCRRILNHYSIQTRSMYATSNLDMDNKPKRPMNKYFTYMTELRTDIQSKHPGLSQTETVKLITQKYKLLSEQEMEVLSHEFSERLEKYKTELAQWESSLSAEEMTLLKSQAIKKSVEQKQKKDKIKHKKMNEDFEKPKKNLSSYMMFLHDRRTKRSPAENYIAWVKKNAEEWNALPAEQKKVYEEKYETLKATYMLDLYNWELKMIEMDHLSLVRKSTLNKLNLYE